MRIVDLERTHPVHHIEESRQDFQTQSQRGRKYQTIDADAGKHQQQSRVKPPGAPPIKRRQIDPTGVQVLRYEQARDQVAAQNKKYIDADIPAPHNACKTGMRKKYRYNGKCA
jgi:hypothetical protein